MGDKGGAPAAPNYSGLIAAATQNQYKFEALMDEQLRFAKDAYKHQLPYTDKYQAQQLETMGDASDFAKSQKARYEQYYAPLGVKFVKEAQDYASPDQMELARGRAMSTVGMTFDTAGDAAKRSLESYGIDPSATRFAALDIGARTAKAAATAAAGNQSDVQRETTGLGLETAAINMGNGLPGQVTGSQNTSTAAGAAGVGAGNSTYGAFSGALGNPVPFGNLSVGSLGQAGNFTGQQYAGQSQQFAANQNASSGFGSMLGGALGIAKMFLEEGGPVPEPMPMAGGSVPPEMSPSGGAVTDDVMATVNGGAIPQAAINTGEFIFPEDVSRWLGEEKLQKMIVKARQDKAAAGAQPEQGPPQGGSPPPEQAGALPINPQPQVRMARGGPVPRPPRVEPVVRTGFAGGNSRIGALPLRPQRPAPYPGGSNAGAVRSAIPGV